MSVVVRELSKRYGEQLALDGISFTARPGEVLGFLGPNGAGKTTTMKILTGYLSQTTGTATVDGHDVRGAAMAARRAVGYLPEHNPLYPEMYVREYLQFAAAANRVPRAGARIEELIERTGLTREVRKRIGALSKGYRQRVGLAQALLHDPQVLILDEPTSGLDPNQLAEIRTLIREIGRTKTVIFSTHIMQEVQAICDRVVIIDRGRLVADDPIDRLRSRLRGASFVEVQFDRSVRVETLAALPGVTHVQPGSEPATYRLVAEEGQDIRPAVFHYAVAQGSVLLELRSETQSMESVFRALTAAN